MTDISWISHQAQQIHGVFMSLFYVLITVLLCLGVFIEYFKWPLGGVPSFSTLVGRTLIAALLLNTYPQVSNTVAELSDALSRQLGDVNQFKVVLSHMGDQLKTLTFSYNPFVYVRMRFLSSHVQAQASHASSASRNERKVQESK